MPNTGSIFRIDIDTDRTRYFWCVGADSSQLGSSLIVVFRQNYKHSDSPDLEAIVADDIDFYCHTFLIVGKKQGVWRKAGYLRVTKTFEMLFRGSEDYGKPSVRVSERWYVWQPNEPYKSVGRLTGDLQNAELGMVFPPECIVERIRSGKYGISHPTYDQALQPCA